MTRTKAKCTAHKRVTGEPCGRWPMKGTTVCPMHGGRAPQVKAAAARRIARQEVVDTLGVYGVPAEDPDPNTLVLREISHSAGHVSFLRDVVQGMDTGELERDETWRELYDTERDRLVRWCDTAARMGIERQRVALAEQIGGALAVTLRTLLNGLGLSPAQWQLAEAAIPAQLRELTASMNG